MNTKHFDIEKRFLEDNIYILTITCHEEESCLYIPINFENKIFNSTLLTKHLKINLELLNKWINDNMIECKNISSNNELISGSWCSINNLCSLISFLGYDLYYSVVETYLDLLDESD